MIGVRLYSGRIGDSAYRNIDARWDALRAIGCVVQVNASSTSQGFDADLNHRRVVVHDTNQERFWCRAPVSAMLTARGPIGAIAAALLRSDDVRLFNDQYIVKPPIGSGASLKSTCFEWHYDSQWCEGDDESRVQHTPYLSAWVALDDVNEENGTLRMLPYPSSVIGETHYKKALAYPCRRSLTSPMSEDVFDADCGRLLTLRAGSVVFFSDVVLHCSGPNISNEERRAWMPQFSDGPIELNGKAISLKAKLVES